jgi:hypothetical protein
MRRPARPAAGRAAAGTLDVRAHNGIGADAEEIPIGRIEQADARTRRGEVKYRFAIDMTSSRRSAPDGARAGGPAVCLTVAGPSGRPRASCLAGGASGPYVGRMTRTPGPAAPGRGRRCPDPVPRAVALPRPQRRRCHVTTRTSFPPRLGPVARLVSRPAAAGALCALAAVAALAACAEAVDDPARGPGHDPAPNAPSYAAAGGAPALVVNVSNDTTSQNETPLAVNPRDPANLITGANDWNYNDGCAVNASFDGGRTWTRTLPRGFIPGITRFTDDPLVAGTGAYDFGGDPAVAFGPDGTAYFACFGYQATPPYGVALLLSRSTDGGRSWTPGGARPLTLVSAFTGDGHARGGTGQFPDHEAIHVARDGTIYVTWAQFNGNGSHSPVYVATSRDGGASFGAPVKVTSGSVRSDQDQRVVTDPATGTAYLTFDNSVQGGKGTAMFVSASRDRGATWSAPVRFATFQNPVCLFPPGCFNISGAPFRGPGSYPAPAFDPTTNRLYVAYTDIVGGTAQILLTSAAVSDLTTWSAPQVVAPAGADRINVEMSIEPASGRIDLMANDRSWSANALFDVTYFGSADHGVTWSVRRVTKTSWDPSQYGVPSGAGVRPFIGDYDGIVSLPSSVGMAWTGPGKTYGALPTNLEIYFGNLTP